MFWRFTATFFLILAAVQPCSISPVRKLWSKDPGSASKLFAFEQNGRVGFIDATGKIVVQPEIEARIEDVGDFSDGLARVDHKGYIDESGRWIIRADYWWTEDFSDGLAIALQEDAAQKGGYEGLVIDTTGKVVARVPARRTESFSEGLAIFEGPQKPGIRIFGREFVYLDFPGLKGFLDRTGNVIIPPAFADVGPFVHGIARAAQDGYCHLAMPDGGSQGTPTTGYPSSCGGAPRDAITPCQVGFINTKGRFVIEPRFESARDFAEDLAAVRIGGLWGFIDRDGTTVIPPKFDEAQSFSEGLAAVRVDDEWGFIDKSGQVVIAPKFEEVEAFSDSMALAYRDHHPFYIDRSGQTRIPGPFLEATPFVDGLAAVLLSQTRVAYINHSGKIVFEYTRHT